MPSHCLKDAFWDIAVAGDGGSGSSSRYLGIRTVVPARMDRARLPNSRQKGGLAVSCSSDVGLIATPGCRARSWHRLVVGGHAGSHPSPPSLGHFFMGIKLQTSSRP